MEWNQSTVYEQRVRFVLEVQQRTFSFAESCRRYNISRTTGYTWWARFLAEDLEGLHDRSHRPHACPHAIPEPVVEHIVALRLGVSQDPQAHRRKVWLGSSSPHDRSRLRASRPAHQEASRPWQAESSRQAAHAYGRAQCCLDHRLQGPL